MLKLEMESLTIGRGEGNGQCGAACLRESPGEEARSCKLSKLSR